MNKNCCIMKKTMLTIALMLCACTCVAQYYLESPDKELRVTLHSNRGRKGMSKYLVPQKMTMKVFSESEVLVDKEIGLTVKSQGHRYAFGKANVVSVNKAEKQIDHPDVQHAGLSDMQGRYNSLIMATDKGIILELRAYNDGVAYRFNVSGYPEDYKILEVCDVFPDESPVAILGTFEGSYVSPWHLMKVKQPLRKGEQEKAELSTTSPTKRLGTRIVPWRDALSSVTVGTAFNWHVGDTWGDFADYHTFSVDFTYKHLFGGLSFMPCGEIQYIVWDEDFWPFEGLMKGIDAWNVGAKAGYCLPVQNGYEVWSFIPYVATTLIHLHQHGKIRYGAKALSHHAHWMVGPGMKVQLAVREGVTFGAGYEYQFFTDNKAPKGMHAISLSIGKTF